MQLQPFLTAYDPTDLPGGSVDPLGFDRGYNWLAEKILPGLTNAADQPRYLSTLCAGLVLADESDSKITPRERLKHRREVVMRMERFWVLGCVLASVNDEPPTLGLRGIRYVTAAREKLVKTGETKADFRLLSRQSTYGLLGIYGNVADNLHLVASDTLTLNTDLGVRLGTSFLDETAAPAALRKAVVDKGSVRIAALTEWSARAHVSARPRAKTGEQRAMREALVTNDARHRMIKLLAEHPTQTDDSELDRLKRVSRSLTGSHRDPDLREALRAILAYERGFRESLLVFQRLLWACQSPPFSVSLASLRGERSLAASRENIARASGELDAALREAHTPAFLSQKDRAADAAAFLRRAARATSVDELASVIVHRHGDVLRGRLLGGRSKMPWIEERGGKVLPTLAAAQRVERPPAKASEVQPHGYRTRAADRMRIAGGLS